MLIPEALQVEVPSEQGLQVEAHCSPVGEPVAEGAVVVLAVVAPVVGVVNVVVVAAVKAEGWASVDQQDFLGDPGLGREGHRD